MKDFPSCFGENAVQVSDFSSSSSNKSAHNLVTSVYQCRFGRRSCLITVGWSKNLMGQGFSVGIDDSRDQCLCKIDVKPWLFSKRKGSKTVETYSSKIDIYWDLSSAKFGSGPEPFEDFYVAIVSNQRMILLLGDMQKEAYKKSAATNASSNNSFLFSKREHIYGKKIFSTKVRFFNNGQLHDLVVECDTAGVDEPCLVIRVDNKNVMQVKRLQWKFRGNHTILVDGIAVEVFWDVHNWIFDPSHGNAVFMFESNVMSDSESSLSWSWSSHGVLDTRSQNHGLSLILYAWKSE